MSRLTVKKKIEQLVYSICVQHCAEYRASQSEENRTARLQHMQQQNTASREVFIIIIHTIKAQDQLIDTIRNLDDKNLDSAT